MSQTRRVAVIGAGLTGLSVAYHLKKLGCQVSVFEASDRPGGLIRSSVDGNWLGESGYGLLSESNEAVTRLINELDLRDEVLEARPEWKKRFLARNGRLKRMPITTAGAISSSFLPFGMRMRMLFGRFRKRKPQPDDTLASLVERYLGPAAVSLIAEPLATALWAGDAGALRARHALPGVFAHVEKKQSLMRGLAAYVKNSRHPLSNPRLIAFRFGLQTLTGAMANALEEDLYLNARVVQVKRHESQWLITLYLGDEARYDLVDDVVFAVPAHALEAIQVGEAVDPHFRRIGRLPYAPLTVLNMGFRKADLEHNLDGMGFLVSQSEKSRLLGVLFSSSIFNERSPGGHHLISVFVGGATNPEFALEPVNKIKTAVLKDLHPYLGVKAYPLYVKPFVYPRALPQPDGTSDDVNEAIAEFESLHDGLHLAGHYRFGVSTAGAIAQSVELADKIMDGKVAPTP